MITGRVVKTFFLGDDEISDSKAYLAICVESYHRTLSGVGVRMIIEVREIVKGILSCLKHELIVNRNCGIESPEPKRIRPIRG